MNNEEKILSMLELLTSDMQDVKGRLTNVEQGQAKLEQDMNERFENLDFKIIKTKVS